MRGLEHLSTLIKWKGTPGVGDFMYGLNVAHFNAYLLNKPVTLEINWFWNVKEQYHFEDPELTIERLEYLHNFYKDQHMVNVEHVFESKDHKVYTHITRGATERLVRASHAAKFAYNNYWHFRDDCHLKPLPTDKNKIVFWRDTFNADIVRKWKRLIDHKEWDHMIHNFEMNGFDPVELTYRTPVREAMYHINTAKMVVCYDGLWHYIAKNFHKPLIVISRSAITRLHTPEALTLDEKDALHYSQNFGAVKKRDIIFPHVHRIDRNNWPNKRMRILGDGFTQLNKRINLYKEKCIDWHEQAKEFTSRQSSN